LEEAKSTAVIAAKRCLGMNADASPALSGLLREIRACTVCSAALPFGPRPVVQAGAGARLLIIGQAPGRRVHETGIPWNDASGERLREWLGLDATRFYDPDCVALMPMGFCYPGATPGAGAKPPRPECAPLWHARLRALLPAVKVTLLVGSHAQAAYLPKSRRQGMTQSVQQFRAHLPAYFPLPHPSWRSTAWMRGNPWFEAMVLPALRQSVKAALDPTDRVELR
jgi:uracil-DNA glycosylase